MAAHLTATQCLITCSSFTQVEQRRDVHFLRSRRSRAGVDAAQGADALRAHPGRALVARPAGDAARARPAAHARVHARQVLYPRVCVYWALHLLPANTLLLLQTTPRVALDGRFTALSPGSTEKASQTLTLLFGSTHNDLQRAAAVRAAAATFLCRLRFVDKLQYACASHWRAMCPVL